MEERKKFAIPTTENLLTTHFGRCEKFAIVETEDNRIISVSHITPPVHQPGIYPRFLADQGVNTIISGGMGIKAQHLFSQYDIEVYLGVNSDSPQSLVKQYLDRQLRTGQNLCDH